MTIRMTICVLRQWFAGSEGTRCCAHNEALCELKVTHCILRIIFFPSQLVLSVCLAFLIGTKAQQTENSRSNGQGCQPPFCFNFDHIFDPIGKKIGKFNAIIGFKTNKINKVLGFKNAVKSFIPVKLQFEIDAIRSAQAVLEAKLQAK